MIPWWGWLLIIIFIILPIAGFAIMLLLGYGLSGGKLP